MASALCARMRVRMHARHLEMTWLMRYAAVVLNRRLIASDGQTAQERIKGRRSFTSVCLFGERVMFQSGEHENIVEQAECGLAWSEDVRKLLLVAPTEPSLVMKSRECQQTNDGVESLPVRYHARPEGQKNHARRHRQCNQFHKKTRLTSTRGRSRPKLLRTSMRRR